MTVNYGFEGFPYDLRVQVLRYVSVIFGVLQVLVMACIHPVAGILLAVQSFAVRYTSVIYLEAVPMLFSLLSIWAFSKSIRLGFSGRKALYWSLVSSIALGITAASKYIYAIVGLTCLVYAIGLIIYHRKFKMVKNIILWCGTSLFIFFICDPYLWPSPIERLVSSVQFSQSYSVRRQFVYYFPFWQSLNWLSQSFSSQNGFHGFYHYGFSAEKIRELSPTIRKMGEIIKADTWIFIAAVLGLPILYKKQPLYFWWLIFSFTFLFIWKVKWPQYVCILLAPWCFSAAYTLEYLWGLIRSIVNRLAHFISLVKP
jgi:hypothetical protein